MGIAALATLAACSKSPDTALSDDLKRDLATVGGGDVQLASMSTPKLDIVSASERSESPMPTPKAKAVSKAPSASRGTKAVVKSVRRETPAPAQPSVQAEDVAPVEAPVVRAPEPVPAAQGRMEAPRPSTQREPPGGWSTPGRIIRNAPFPINP
jgi:hypothetical protein